MNGDWRESGLIGLIGLTCKGKSMANSISAVDDIYKAACKLCRCMNVSRQVTRIETTPYHIAQYNRYCKQFAGVEYHYTFEVGLESGVVFIPLTFHSGDSTRESNHTFENIMTALRESLSNLAFV